MFLGTKETIEEKWIKVNGFKSQKVAYFTLTTYMFWIPIMKTKTWWEIEDE